MHIVLPPQGEPPPHSSYEILLPKNCQERDHMVRAIRCIGVVPWGYTDDRDLLVCPDPCDFANVK